MEKSSISSSTLSNLTTTLRIRTGTESDPGVISDPKVKNMFSNSSSSNAANSLRPDLWPSVMSGLTDKVTPRAANDSSLNDKIYDVSPVTNNKTRYAGLLSADIGTSGNEKDIFTVPSWGIKDFINEKMRWQKGIDEYSRVPAFCYFKIFFDFDSDYGLLGTSGQNTAYEYLYGIWNSGRMNDYYMQDKITCLDSFRYILRYIENKAPWFFKSIQGLDNSAKINFSNLSEEKTFLIECMPDAVDMRLTSLLDLYKNACFDVINQKEVIPENLRKFNIKVVVFQSPIKYYHTSFKGLSSSNGTKYKSMDADDFDDRFSFKMVTFNNCEIVAEEIANTPNKMDNTSPFQLENTIKIKYDRAYESTLNEWMRFYINPNRISEYKVNDKELPTRIQLLQKALNNIYYYNPNSSSYQALIDASEDLIQNALRAVNDHSFTGAAYNFVNNWASDKIDKADAWLNEKRRYFQGAIDSRVCQYSKGIYDILCGGNKNNRYDNNSAQISNDDRSGQVSTRNRTEIKPNTVFISNVDGKTINFSAGIQNILNSGITKEHFTGMDTDAINKDRMNQTDALVKGESFISATGDKKILSFSAGIQDILTPGIKPSLLPSAVLQPIADIEPVVEVPFVGGKRANQLPIESLEESFISEADSKRIKYSKGIKDILEPDEKLLF